MIDDTLIAQLANESSLSPEPAILQVSNSFPGESIDAIDFSRLFANSIVSWLSILKNIGDSDPTIIDEIGMDRPFGFYDYDSGTTSE